MPHGRRDPCRVQSVLKLSDELVKKATKEQLTEVARILALQSALDARKYGELPLPAVA